MSSKTDRLDALAGSVAGERARVDETVKEIQQKLTPGQLIDEVLRQGGEPAVNAIAGLGKTIAAHPIPALLIGTALVWLAIERRPTGKDQPPTSPAA
jgi:hypothetical protein